MMIIIVDEVQDMNFNYCYYINKIIRDNKKTIHLLLS